jgi:hypothetical protein
MAMNRISSICVSMIFFSYLLNESQYFIDEKQLLDHLQPVGKAMYESQRGDRCLIGTRKSMLDKLVAWRRDTKGSRVFWLIGMAGTGKSAIARTFCDILRQKSLLGGAFFCSRLGSEGRNDVSRIFPTLAHLLADYNEHFRSSLLQNLKRESNIGDFTLDRQLEGLIIVPSKDVFKAHRMPVVVIDALDECSDDADTKRLLAALLSQAESNTLPFKFLVTSRPEDHIRRQFNLESKHQLICSLHDIEKDIVDEDISCYIRHRLEHTQATEKSFSFTGWIVQTLTKRAERLFIYAFTACNYIDDDPCGGLQRLIDHTKPVTGVIRSELDEMYSLVLDKALNPKMRDDAVVENSRKVLRYLVTAQATFPVSELAIMLKTTAEDIRTSLKWLHSLIFVPSSDEHGSVTTLHASFGDYLGDERRSHRHFISEADGHEILTELCWNVLSELRFNIAGFTTSYKYNWQQEHTKIPTRVIYGCRYWVHHLTRTGDPAKYIKDIENIFFPKFLFWLEVMSIEGQVDVVPNLLKELLPAVEVVGFLLVLDLICQV